MHDKPLDLLLLDCHHFPATVALMKRLLIITRNMLVPNAILALHDTGLHPVTNLSSVRSKLSLIPLPVGSRHGFARSHQPVERLFAQWLKKFDVHGDWQTLALHDDDARGVVLARHGLTIMQRKQSLHVPSELCDHAHLMGMGGTAPAGGSVACLSIQSNLPHPNALRSPAATPLTGRP